MKKYLFLLLIVFPLLAQSQIVRSFYLDNDSTRTGDDSIKIYRLDDAQKQQIIEKQFSKNKLENDENVKYVLHYYNELELVLDSISADFSLIYNGERLYRMMNSYERIENIYMSPFPNKNELKKEIEFYRKKFRIIYNLRKAAE